MIWVRQWDNCSPTFCTSSAVIKSGPGAELLFEFFMACFICVMLKKISEELLWFRSKTESISSSISCSNCKSKSFFPIFSIWNFCSFSDIFLSSKMCRPDGLNNVICFPPRTLSYLFQNWVEFLDSFKNFVLDLYYLSFPSEMAVWYFSLTSSIFCKFARDFLNLYLFTGSFISFLAALILLFHQPLALLFDISAIYLTKKNCCRAHY